MAGIERYAYDGLGRRTTSCTASNVCAYQIYSQAGQLLFTSDGRNDKRVEQVYLGGSLVAQRERPLSSETETVKYQHTDALGTPVVTGPNGGVFERWEYEPYGRQLVPTALTDGPGFTGHVTDAATGLVYMQQRYYAPTIGRFLSVDQVVAYEKPVTNFNRYVYARNNPYKFTDPDGRDVACNGTTCNIRCQGVECLGDFAKYRMIRMLSNAADLTRVLFPIIQQSQGASPPLPEGMVGTKDGEGGRTRTRENSGPLAPEHGGAGNAETDFDHLTGGNSSPPGEGSKLSEGSKVGGNGIIFRPGKEGEGPRIDIPASGDKPRETLHYPKPDERI